MELERVIEILEKHQEWRRDQNVPPKTEMQSPIEIGTAIDYALTELKKLRLGGVVNQRELLIAYGQELEGRSLYLEGTTLDEFTDKYISNL